MILLKYLYATLPHELTGRFVDVVFAVSRSLALPVSFKGAEISEARLRELFEQAQTEVLTETGEDAGSEGLAILIHKTYPRR